MKRLAAIAGALILAGCATSAALPPGTVVPEAKLAQQAVQDGVTTRAQLLALFGPTTSIRFANGVEVWRYLLPPAGQGSGYGEYVLVIDPGGVVSKSRRSPIVYQIPGEK